MSDEGRRLKPFHVFSTVWHEKGEPYCVTSYSFYVVATSKTQVQRMISAEVKSYRHWKHDISIEEIQLKEKQLRRLSSHRLTDKIIADSIAEILKIGKKKHANLRARLEENRLAVFSVPIEELLKSPALLYGHLARNLTPNSKVVIDEGKLFIYYVKKREKTFREMELIECKEKLLTEVKGITEKNLRDIDNLLNRGEK